MTVYAKIIVYDASFKYDTYVESDSLEELNVDVDAIRNAIERQYTIRINYPKDQSSFINSLNIAFVDIYINVAKPSDPDLIGKLVLSTLIRG